MGKEKPGFLTPKAISNRIKSKGLQKLRWYCQMCEKQCRDENGFKCHAMSESHQRQLLLFAENSRKYLDGFSSEFNREYVNTLKRRFGTKRVHANVVYQEYISDRNHIHMNSTQWMTLTDYVKWLGRKGICVVDETEKGWFVTYIDRDPETMRRQAEAEKKRKLDLDDTQRQQMFLEKQMERAKDSETKPVEAPTELKKAENEVIKIAFKKTTNRLLSDKPTTSKSAATEDQPENQEAEYSPEENEQDDSNDQEFTEEEEEMEEAEEDNGSVQNSTELPVQVKQENEDIASEKPAPKAEPFEPTPMTPRLAEVKNEDLLQTAVKKEAKPIISPSVQAVFKVPIVPMEKSKPEKRKQSALDELIQEEERRKEAKNRKDYWLHKDIVVKITTNKLGEKYFKKKGVVKDVVDRYTAVVKLLDSEAVIKLDQAHLETVLPAVGKQVLVVNGAYRGEIAILEDIDQDKFCAKISIACGPLKGRVVNGVQYEDISKLNN